MASIARSAPSGFTAGSPKLPKRTKDALAAVDLTTTLMRKRTGSMASFGNAPAETARDNDKVVPGPASAQ